MQPLPIYSGSHKTKTPKYANQTLINWYGSQFTVGNKYDVDA